MTPVGTTRRHAHIVLALFLLFAAPGCDSATWPSLDGTGRGAPPLPRASEASAPASTPLAGSAPTILDGQRPVTASISQLTAGPSPSIMVEDAATGLRGYYTVTGSVLGVFNPIATIPSELRMVAYADFTGDDAADMLFENSRDGSRWVLQLSAADIPVTWRPVNTVPTEWHIAGAASLTNGATPDILWQNIVTGEIGLYRMSGTSVLGWTPIGRVDSDLRMVAVGDFTGDGKPDLVFENLHDNKRWVLQMNGASAVAWSAIGAMPADLRIRAAGDFTGDGQLDLLVENVVDGSRWILRMTGTAAQAWIALATLPTSWRITGIRTKLTASNPLTTTQAVPNTAGIATVPLSPFTPVTASGGLPPYTFLLSGGTLPNGLGFNQSTGQVGGTPTTTLATTTFTVTVRDAATATSSKTFTLTVATPPSLSVVNTFSPNATTISTSEGAPYGDADIWSRPAATNLSNFGYGPTKIVRLYVCLSGEVQVYYRCSDRPPTTGPLSAAMLQNIDAGIAAYAGTGVRLLVRFIYNFGPIGAPDAPVATISNHIDQLAPILLKYRDLIFALEAGFVGTWGEWHHSTNGNDAFAAHKAVLDKETSYFKNVFPILLRYPKDLIDYAGRVPDSGLGLHDDYYASEAFDGGTWNSTADYTTADLKAYAAAASITSMFTGEFGAVYQPLQTCSALADYSYTYHLQSISLFPFPPEVGTLLATEGCASSFFGTVGTRIELQRIALLGDARASGRVHASVTMRSAGYGRVIRPRPVSLVLLSNNHPIATIALATTDLDLRTLASTVDRAPRTFEFDFVLPAVLPSGQISVALFIADPAPSLTSQAAYALPLNSLDAINRPVFDPVTGYNLIAVFTPPTP